MGNDSSATAPADDSSATAVRGAFPVVGIGSSAGGLEALTELLNAIQFDSMGFVVVQHRSPQQESLLVELLARSTRMQVEEITDGVVVRPNHVYLAPAGAQVALLGRALQVVPSTSRLPIDLFFRSLAEELGEHAIGIVLSGMGSDGTSGLQAIKEHGGICIAQSPETAKFDAMPRSAIDARVVDAVLSPVAIADELASVGRHPYMRPGPRPPSVGLQKLYVLLRDAFGHDLSCYKENTIGRRIERRMAVQKVDRLDDYLRLIQAHPDELKTLYRDLLINVTNFFRDPAAFELLEKSILPRIVANKSAGEILRVWVPACSSGEEAYSIAMCAVEALGARASDFTVQIFGTDIDVEAIEQARKGFYPPSIESDVSVERLARFFVKVDGGYQVGRRLRALVIFSVQDVAKDPPLSRMDLVSCRNLLIYMQPPLQKRVLGTLHYALRNDGYLLLGSSETVGEAGDLFSVVDRKTKIYAKKAIGSAAALYFGHGAPAPAPTASEGSMARRPVQTAQQLADRRLLDHYAPPSVLVTDDLDVLLFRGDTAAYVSPAPGAATLNVMRLVRPELHLQLWQAIEKARADDAPVRLPALRFETTVGDQVATHHVSIEVAPLQLPDAQGRCLLIVFHELADGPAAASREGRTQSPPPTQPARDDDRSQALEQELAATRELLQSTIEELESSNEELKSANEELQSANEELQSTNEELESSKEELQSSNEELSTVNDELQRRLGDLLQRDSELSNFLRAVRDPMLFIDRAGHLRHFSEAAAELFALRPADLGGGIEHLRSRLGGAKLDRVLLRCAERIAPATEEVLAFDNRWYALTAQPYANAQGTLDGAVVTLVDIDATKRTAEQRVDVSAYAEKVLPAVLHPLVMLDEQHRVVWANAAFYDAFHADAESTLGNLFHNLGTGQWAHPALREHIDRLLGDGQAFRDFLVTHDFKVSGTRQMRVSGSRVKDVGTAGPVALLSIIDAKPQR